MISILIPIYNGIEFIEDSVSSVLNQTYGNWELLIGVNGHPKNSDVFKKAKEYEKTAKIRVFDFYNIKGKSNTLNEMVKFCNYKYIALLDVDDIWHPQKLEVQSKLFIHNYDVIGSRCIWFGDKPSIIPFVPTGDISKFDFSSINPIINSSSIIKKEFCYWNENGIEDYDLWLRLKKANKRFFNCNEILVSHRIHTSSAFNANGNNDKKVDILLIRHGLKSRSEKNNNPSKINIPQVNRIGMRLF
jgi:glycosyltransferase involved in cell wall biosynthesis